MRAEEMLEAEERKLQARISHLNRRLTLRPDGCFTVKRIHGRRYAYVARRIRGKLRFEYAGPADRPSAERLRRALQVTRRLKSNLRQAQSRLRRIQRALARLRPPLRIDVNRDAIARLTAPGRRNLGEIGPGISDSIMVQDMRASMRVIR